MCIRGERNYQLWWYVGYVTVDPGLEEVKIVGVWDASYQESVGVLWNQTVTAELPPWMWYDWTEQIFVRDVVCSSGKCQNWWNVARLNICHRKSERVAIALRRFFSEKWAAILKIITTVTKVCVNAFEFSPCWKFSIGGPSHIQPRYEINTPFAVWIKSGKRVA